MKTKNKIMSEQTFPEWEKNVNNILDKIDKICKKFLQIITSEKLMMALIFFAFLGMGYLVGKVLGSLIF